MNTFWILMEQIELFIVYLVIGMILVRTGVLSDKGLDWIARVVMKLSLPTMIFVNVISQVDRTALVQSLSIIGLAVTASILLFGLGVALTKLFHVEGDRSQIYRAMTMFGNVDLWESRSLPAFSRNGACCMYPYLPSWISWRCGR